MAKSPDEMAAAMIANLPEKTGKDLNAWLKVVKASKLTKHGEVVKWLKSEHGVTHGFANLIAHKAFKSDAGSQGAEVDLVDAMYAGPKAALRPIYDALATVVAGLGKDVEVAPKKTYVSFRRKKQFALVQPSTKDRVDVGINLKGVAPTGRLEPSGSFNAMVSHRVRVSDRKDVNAELKAWLKQAYDAAG